jgi:hypothetical protein
VTRGAPVASGLLVVVRPTDTTVRRGAGPLEVVVARAATGPRTVARAA